MRHFPLSGLALAGVLLFSLSGYAQSDFDRYQDRESQRSYHAAHIFDRTRADLDRAAEMALPFTPDRERVVRAQQELNEMQNRLNSGSLDDHSINDAVAAIDRVVDSNSLLNGQIRDNLRDDMHRLREFQDRQQFQERQEFPRDFHRDY